ncbi:TauD/TfdA family dioxygenase [Micromonospora sp. CA-263727]|uniref:TauD/TfdA family dioxygenase n=1 Tax=Micromonospora sp. CA-263727 TaxID=3239967 RepID=UPI003D8A431D
MTTSSAALSASGSAADFRRLSAAAAAQCRTAIEHLRATSPLVDNGAFIDAAKTLSSLLPASMCTVLDEFQSIGNNEGRLVIEGLPVCADLPLTPQIPNSVARETTPAVGALALVMSHLGDPIAYPEEKLGALVHDVCPVPGEENEQQNTGSVLFELHTENAFHPVRPDFLGLLCLRTDHDGRAASVTSSILQALPRLGEHHLTVLREPRFQTRLAPSFCRNRPDRPYHAAVPVLTGTTERPLLCVDFDDTRGCDRAAERALDALHAALRDVRVETLLRPGSLVILDNSVTVHGRNAFTPRYDGRDRWLQRMFAIRSARRTADMFQPGSAFLLRELSTPPP